MVLAVRKLAAKLKRREWNPPLHWGHTPYVKAFLHSVIQDTEPPTSPQEARRSLELATAMYESAIHGIVVTFPLPRECTLYHGMRTTAPRAERGGLERLHV